MQRRERYRVEGARMFGDAELIALLIGTGTRGRSALQIAAGLLERFDGLPGLARQQPQALMGEVGVGPERAVRVLAALEAGRRSLSLPPLRDPIGGPDDAYEVLGPALRGLLHEELHGLFLDRRRRPLARRLLTQGSDAYTVVDPRQIFRVAIGVGASAVVLAHNHPSGDPTPSSQDIEVTQRVARAGRLLGVPLVDHLVIGANDFVSLAAGGLVPDADRDTTPACIPR